MRKLLPLHPWLRVLLHTISLNKVQVAGTVHKPLSEMKDGDAIQLGKGLSTIILSTTEAGAAVDHWIAQNAPLEEFEKEYEWMRPFFIELAQHNFNTSNLGLRLRVVGGAVLSTVDLVTDIYMTVQFFNTDGQESYGMTNAWLIGLTMLFQIFVSYTQNSKKLSFFFQDSIFTLIRFRPALDAYRVGSGAEMEEHQNFSPLKEMTFCKGGEMIFEAIPGLIVQIYALLLAKEKNMGALISIFVSAATIAFTSSMISYDWDTSPDQRNTSPSFYGYVPDKTFPRAICFLSMMSLSFAHVTLLTFSCALLALMKTGWLLYFLGLDLGLFFLYKIVRRDFYYFMNLDGVVRVFTALLTHFGVKILVNFTMTIHCRHPNEAGGVMFLFSIMVAFISSFASAYLFINYYQGEAELDEDTLRAVLGSLYSIWLISLVSFASVIKREYLHTFYDTYTTSSFNRKWFVGLREDQDIEKSSVFFCHLDVYARWADEMIKPWTLNSWAKLEDEKPAWFTDNWIDKVPNDFIPLEFRVNYKKTRGRVDDDKLMRRRGSMSVREMLGGEGAGER